MEIHPMTQIVKTCHIHGRLTQEQCIFKKHPKYPKGTYACRQCNYIYGKKYREKNLTYFRTVAREYSQYQAKHLTDRYIKQVINMHKKCKMNTITPEDIAKKREYLIKLRQLRSER